MRVAQVLFQGMRWCVEATDRLVFLSRKLSHCSFSCFEGEVGLLNCSDFNPVPRGTRNHLHEALWNSGRTSADSGLQLDWGGSRTNGVSAKIQPLRLIQPCRR